MVNLVKSKPRSRKMTVKYGESKIEFKLYKLSRKTIEIAVLPDMTVEVKVPEKATLPQVKARVIKRARWIIKQQQEFETYLPHQPERKYLSGETHRYLGRQYRLKVLKSKEDGVKLLGKYLQVRSTKKTDPKHTKRLVQQWFREHGETKIAERFEVCLTSIKRLKIDRPELTLKRMKTRWGSCTADGKILLNPELVHAPTQCIDYVIIHELCHLREHNHSKKFYALLSRIMPDWQKRQKRLNFIQY